MGVVPIALIALPEDGGTIMILGLTVFVWCVAGARLVATWWSGWRHWRSALTIATSALAGVVTLYLWRHTIDTWLGAPNLSGLLGRVLVIVGLIAVQWTLTWPSVYGRWVSGSVGAISTLVLIAAWVRAPLHERQVASYSSLTSHPAVLVYTVVFYAEILVILIQLWWGLLKRQQEAVVSGDRIGGRALGLGAWGCLPIAGTMVTWSIDVLTGGAHVEVSTWGRFLLLSGSVVLCCGLAWIIAGPWVQAQLELRRVSLEWRPLIALCPEVRLRSEVWDRLVRPELVLVRRLIEIEDAKEAVSARTV